MKPERDPAVDPGSEARSLLGVIRERRAAIALPTLLFFSSSLLYTSPGAAAPGDQARDVAGRVPLTSGAEQTRQPQRDLDSLQSTLRNAEPVSFSNTSVDLPNPVITAPAELSQLPKGGAEVSAQAIAPPSGGGTVSGMGESFSAQLTTGIATLNVPIALPDARARVRPALSLVYSSSAGYGTAGVGWGLAGQMFIARQSDRGVPTYDDQPDWHPNQDRFVFGGQELVPICTVTGGSCTGAQAGEQMPIWSEGWQYFRARVEGAFLRFFWSPDHRTWRVQSKEGVNTELGSPLDTSGYTGGLEANPDRPFEIFRWHVVRQYDSHGQPDALAGPLPANLAVYRYRHDAGQVYLSDVFYTPPAQGPATAELSSYAYHAAIRYELRPDTVTSYRAGWAQEQRLRIAHVDVTSKPFAGAVTAARQLVRRYHLSYDPSSHASVLSSVQAEGRCPEPVSEGSDGTLPTSSCPRLPPMTLEYQRVSAELPGLEDAHGLSFEPFNEVVQAFQNSPPHSLDEEHAALTDINADALPDVLVTAPALFGGKHGVFFNGDNGGLRFSAAAGIAVSGVTGVDASVLAFDNPNVNPLDVDGDAVVDLVHMPLVKKYEVFSARQLSSGWTWVGRPIEVAATQDPKIDLSRDRIRTAVLDVNADGLVDVVFSSATEMQTFFGLGRYAGGDGRFGQARWSTASTADLSTEPVTACTPWSGSPVRIGDPDVRVAEMNGDGIPDLVRARSGQVLYWPGRGNGFWGTGARDDCPAGGFGQDRHIEMINAPRFEVTQPGNLQLADVNGDGLSDLVEVRFNAVDIYLNDSALGWTARHALLDVPIRPNGTTLAQLADVNGSGTADVVWGHGHDYRFVDLTGGVQPYLLTRVHSGLGRTTDFEYSTSTRLMLQAAEQGRPWSSVMPITVPVIVKSTVRDNLDLIGRRAGAYVTEYSYRDPVFEGRQREFRGFKTAETRRIGDPTSPTAIQRSTFLLGECRAAQNGVDVCRAADRWKDNWREALKGKLAIQETFDVNEIYQSTAHVKYELRQLYAGRDGRRVTVAFAAAQESFAYDVANFSAAPQSVQLDEVDVRLPDIVETETRPVIRQASQGTVRLRDELVIDNFGNPTTSIRRGCVEGCGAGDEAITDTADFSRPAGDQSGWLWRVASSRTFGSVHTQPRRQMRYTYNASGDLTAVFGMLSGTLPLDRSNPSGGGVAPAPATASGGIDAPIEIQLIDISHDIFGNALFERGASARCRGFSFDPQYAQFVVTETVFGGAPGATGCGATEFVSQATYDRGLGRVATVRDVRGQPSRYDYDEMGRLLAKTPADPDAPGQLAAHPQIIYEYQLPAQGALTPYSVVRIRAQDGATPNTPEYHEQYTYLDGLGRVIVTLSEADPAAGDGGDWVAGGVALYNEKGAPILAYDRWFYSGDPLDFPLNTSPPGFATSREYDAFGRLIAGYERDGQAKVFARYHARTWDTWDAGDLAAGPHQGSFVTLETDGHGRTTRSITRVHVGGGALEQRERLVEYLPTGEPLRVVERRAGSPDVVRWFRYDTFGRVVLNVEPNTSLGFTPDPNANPATIRAWRYAYDTAGSLVGTSDARGCGSNYAYDTAGRLRAEDYSPCEAHHAPYTPPDIAARSGVEVLHHYDTPDPESSGIADASGRQFTFDAALLRGQLVSTSDRGAKRIFRHDALGRTTAMAVRVARPGPAAPNLADRYAPRWYLQETVFDSVGRALELSTGATLPELLGSDGRSVLTSQYTRRGMLREIAGSYGTMTTDRVHEANGNLLGFSIGDVAGTRQTFEYDIQLRLRRLQVFRAAPALWSNSDYPPGGEDVQQLLLQDSDLEYDTAGNIRSITDWRISSDWPNAARPVTRHFEYDDEYRLKRTRYEYPSSAGTDSWVSPFAAENADATRPQQPSPHVSFDQRVLDQRWSYDHLGNTTLTSDDAAGFFDRSLGAITNGNANLGPHQLRSASNRASSPASPRRGDLSVAYDPAGNVTDLIVRRDGPCLPAGASCWQRFKYAWDEVRQLAGASRWDLAASGPSNERTSNGSVESPLPGRPPDAQLSYAYDANGTRVLIAARRPSGSETHTVYVFGTLQLRNATWSGAGSGLDYSMTPATTQVLLNGSGAKARVVYVQQDLLTLTSGRQRVFYEFADHLGSTTIVIDQQTSELVEYAAYQPYGGSNGDYRPQRWGSYREPGQFGGKEEDVEVGLVYVGARYLSLGLGRWMSPDPLTIHALKSGANPYSYVSGRPTMAVDPSGKEIITLILIGIAVGALIGAAIAGGATIANEWSQKGFKPGDWDWGRIGVAAGMGALAGGLIGGLTAAGLGPTALAWLSTTAAGGTAGLVPTLVAAGYAAGAGALIGATVAGASGGSTGDILTASLRGAEAGALTVIGASLGAWMGAKYATWIGFGSSWLPTTLAISGGLNGMISGARGIYENPLGPVAFGLDSTWGQPFTIAGLGLHVANLGADYDEEASQGHNRHVYTNGVASYDALTLGNVESYKGNAVVLDDHEDMHIWQARLAGPAYPGIWGVMLVTGLFVASGYAIGTWDADNWGPAYVTWTYWDNPWEMMAYGATNDEDYNPPIDDLAPDL